MSRNGNMGTRNGSSSYFKENMSDRAPQMDQQELFKSVNSGINFDKYEDIDVQFTGENSPKPIASFTDLKLHIDVEENITLSGYTKPTPVQKYSIPTLIGGRDLMSCAQTGSGKTAAFLVPIINHILVGGSQAIKKKTMSHSGRYTHYPAALVLAPTRELAMQIHKEALKFSNDTGLEPAMLYGGRENYRTQVNQLNYGAHILIATPGRLVDCINEGYIGLEGCRFFVLDEADRMLDMGFEPQIKQVVSLGKLPPSSDRLTAMFSATFPKQIQKLAQSFLKPNYMFLSVGRVGSTSENIYQSLLWVEKFNKRKILLQILEDEGAKNLVLVFMRTKRSCDELVLYLERQGIRSVAIHGDLQQYEREQNLQLFKSGKRSVLIATAVAARGLDIPNVMHVVNYDLPADIDEYVHRIGRTGRCGNLGKATSFYNSENSNLQQDLLKIFQEGKYEIPDFLSSGGFGGSSNTSSNKRFGGNDSRRSETQSSFKSSFGNQRSGFERATDNFGEQAMSGGSAHFNSRPSENSQGFGRDNESNFSSKREFGAGSDHFSNSGGFGGANASNDGNGFGQRTGGFGDFSATNKNGFGQRNGGNTSNNDAGFGQKDGFGERSNRNGFGDSVNRNGFNGTSRGRGFGNSESGFNGPSNGGGFGGNTNGGGSGFGQRNTQSGFGSSNRGFGNSNV